MTRLYLIRHGEPTSSWGDAAGEADPGLSDRGLAQAQAAADRLVSFQHGERPDRAITSPLRRCRETAQPFADRIGAAPLVVPEVAEIPTPAGVSGRDRASWLRQAMAGAWSEIAGLDGAAWRRGVVNALLRAQGAAVFTHFVAINAAVTAAQGSEAVLAFQPAPGSITTLEVCEGRLKLVSLGDALTASGRVL